MAFRGLVLLAVTTCIAAWGCGGSSEIDSGTGGSSTGATSGSGGSATGGGGSGTGGTAGTSVGGAGGAGGTAVGGAAGAPFWPAPYDPNGTPDPPNGEHNAGLDCLSCHNPTGPGADALWLFGGTVFKADKTSPAPNVEVGVADGTQTYTTYSASNGNFWYPAGPVVDWSTVLIKIRNSNGEAQMSATPTGGGCNSCHTGPMVIVEP